MAGIRGQNTKPEVLLRRALHARGFRYRLHVKKLAGRPDLVLPKYRAAIFVHGCFWHRHDDCKYAATPSTRAMFWQAKFQENVKRDVRVREELGHARWRVAIVWECALRGGGDQIEGTASRVASWLYGDANTLEVGGQDL